MTESYKLSIVIPVYNEEKNIPALIDRLKMVIINLGCSYELIFSMDPSTDLTEKIILDFRENDKNIKLIKMSRRFGQPACTIAGIKYCNGDICVVIDADLQDPPELITEMISKWKEGYDVVYAQRTHRDGESFIKKCVAYSGYWIIDKISDIKIPRNTGDFRLLDRKVIDQLKNINDNDAFLRGLVAYIGFKQIAVPFRRNARNDGKGKYNKFFGSITIALNGVLGFSKYPLHLISVLGLIISSFSILLGLIYLFLKIIDYDIKWGNPTLVILISFLSGIQLLSLGIMGQYFARMYDNIKERPLYIVDEAHGFEELK